MFLDAGFLISIDRDERRAKKFLLAAKHGGEFLQTTEAVVAQVWRGGSRQVPLARFLNVIDIVPLANGHAIGELLARSSTNDVVDADLVLAAARTGERILTSDPDDLSLLAASLGSRAPKILQW